jgi:YegS/Rv2252/BmrU family lipid kinase
LLQRVGVNYSVIGREELHRGIIQEKDLIIAVGGDGTVNEVASVLTETTIPLGIIPVGSGNGLARHLLIPLKFEAALDKAMHGHEIGIDVGLLNNKMFFCTAGIGFDAKVAQLFAKSNQRGFINYIKATLTALTMYKPIEISINHGPVQKVYSLTFANASQFGSNAYISPFSDLQDAYLEMVNIKPFHLLNAVLLVIQLFSKNIHQSNKVNIQSIKSITIQYKEKEPLHIDGEALLTNHATLEISIDPLALLVIV